ncbi:MAG: Crp/Fnr family transcriptional regulator [Chloroflexi bacterium CFX4]|nr:Crp/Fnr family transcriptional regulator [Chloroflexi bacterium CFX4]MDL1923927.1 Crp/Fnr family transcriptional regulator [Chloroflexi bacterium CFX3]
MPTPTGYLTASPYFAGIQPDTLNSLARQMVFRTFPANQIIFLEGDPCEGLWFIQTGRVKISKLNSEGVEHVMHILGEGNSFNDIAALDGGACPATATALSEVAAWLLPHDVLAAHLLQDSQLATNTIRLLATRVRGLVRQIEDLALYSVKVRLARFLLQQAENPALSGVGVTRATIAAHLASTPQTVSTLLRELENDGAIQFDRHHIYISDAERLRGIAAL